MGGTYFYRISLEDARNATDKLSSIAADVNKRIREAFGDDEADVLDELRRRPQTNPEELWNRIDSGVELKLPHSAPNFNSSNTGWVWFADDVLNLFPCESRVANYSSDLLDNDLGIGFPTGTANSLESYPEKFREDAELLRCFLLGSSSSFILDYLPFSIYKGHENFLGILTPQQAKILGRDDENSLLNWFEKLSGESGHRERFQVIQRIKWLREELLRTSDENAVIMAFEDS